MYPTYADPADLAERTDVTDADESTVIEQAPHWSSLKRSFVAAFTAITVVRPTKEAEAARVQRKALEDKELQALAAADSVTLDGHWVTLRANVTPPRPIDEHAVDMERVYAGHAPPPYISPSERVQVRIAADARPLNAPAR